LIPFSTIFTPETLPDSIRQSFFLKDEAEVTPEVIAAFNTGIANNDFATLAGLVSEKRTDGFNIFLTHDVDWLNPAHPYSILKYIYSRVNAGYPWFPPEVMTQKDALLRNIERLITLEQKQHLSSLFFCGAGIQSMGRHDIRYTAHSSLFHELMALLNRSEHIVVGLHSSYNACARKLIDKEKNTLETFTGKKVNIHRSHFLHYDPDGLYSQLEVSGIQYDFGYGHARTVGFKNSFPGKFKPVNTAAKRVYDVTCIPLVLMDNAFFFHPHHEVLSQFRSSIRQLKHANGSASILFHPENMILKPELWHYYEEIIDICLQAGANINPNL